MNLRRAYIPHEILVGPARARSELWRVFAGCGVIFATAMLLSALASFVMWFILQPQGQEIGDPTMGQTPLSLLFLLGGFVFLTLGTAVAARLLHDRSLFSILGPPRAVMRDFLRVFRGLVVLGVVVFLLPPYDIGAQLTPNLPFFSWLLLLPFSLLVLLIQTSAEEIVFRGYLQQQLAARFSSPLVWVAVPSALFAFGHYLPAEAGNNAIFVAAWAGLFGVLMADLTARAGNLGPAIAVHFANNLSAIILVSLPDQLSGLSLYTIDIELSDPGALQTWLPIDFGMMILMWLTARLVIRR
ncbi:CPBP family intramembrane glutamic endopeptidase [Aestuariivita boseongensis]|uniref:CPBP family intramembrane glutamic endopeptidase n=1 Tax=Aestuariivita boseongensis TaxID=1470562 RepID=UPI00068150A9|nr:CPBP family intramembrane glutamic endopeptidase [Aestuariivita boseongensis]